MFAVNGSPAEFQHAGAQRLIRREIELLLGIVPAVPCGRDARLHAVGAHDAPHRVVFLLVLDDEVLADIIELVRIQPGSIRTLQPLTQFDIEDPEAQPASGDAVLRRLRQAQAITAHLGVDPIGKRIFR